jgi:RNA polymerase sigma-70 factor (ECF subfamily)
VDLTFEELYRGHRADVYRAALRELGNVHDAEDVTQAAFADAYRAVLSGTRPQSPRAWLLAISENVRRRRFRTAQRRPGEELVVDDADFPPAAELPYEQSRELAEALAALPAEQRRVFVLREIAGLSYAEIADESASTVASVQMLLFRARRSLRQQLDPPTVASRRPVFLPPVPSWLAGLFSRVELASLTPRAAGALGATVLAVAGASVAVPIPQAAARDAARSAAAARAAAAEPAAAPATTKPTPLSVKRTAAPRTVGRAALNRRPARPTQPVASPPPASTPTAVPSSAPAPAAAPTRTQSVLVATVAKPQLEVALPQVELPQVELPQVSVPPLPLPLPGPAPSLPPALSDVVGTATGAAGAAGASAPPVPVPTVPLPTLPHAP